ncbi:MAG: prohibitin family protein [Bacteroidales bacterium]|jgi:regulator of protease activity HflC (stomatin/prohibitin superfamily)|nr:prohibitin family protein [Bacteroidales bacterium]MBR4177617.1 prohibitin family protein [Bacteroidales bacterium]MBR4715242.1 prohibitin family protein [Bacteroidales bacterium]
MKKLKDMSVGQISLLALLALLALITVFSSFYTIKSTERGVLSTFGKISSGVIEDGLHVKIPFIQTVKKVNVQQKKFDGTENSYTRDVQTSEVQYTINYDLVRENVNNLIRNVGDDYHNRIVVPFIRSAMKQAFGNFAATEIVENRDAVRREIESMLRRTLDSNYFLNIQFQLVNIDFDDDFENAIKEKQVAEQQALKAKNVTIQIEEQAKQTKIRAEADAEAIRIKAKALESNPKLVEYEAVQKWDGKMPQYMMGNSLPLINLK